MLTIHMLKLITSAQGVEVEVCALAMNGQNVNDMVTEDVTPDLETCRRAVFFASLRTPDLNRKNAVGCSNLTHESQRNSAVHTRGVTLRTIPKVSGNLQASQKGGVTSGRFVLCGVGPLLKGTHGWCAKPSFGSILGCAAAAAMPPMPMESSCAITRSASGKCAVAAAADAAAKN
jgi:hypothetical protein